MMNKLRFTFGRLVAFFYRFSTLRLARVIFRNVDRGTVLNRKFGNARIHLDVSRSNAQQLLWLTGKQFVQELPILSRLVRPGFTIVDVGANIGYYALIFAELIQREGSILCFEPDDANRLELRRNIEDNGLASLVEIRSAAVGDFDGRTDFEPGLNGQVVCGGSRSVEICRLDSLRLSKVDLLKIDVEGFEGAVLKGGEETISRFQPAIFLELHPRLSTNHTHGEIISWLTDHYTVVKAYRFSRGRVWQRLLNSYGLSSGVEEVTDIHAVVDRFERGVIESPYWFTACRSLS